MTRLPALAVLGTVAMGIGIDPGCTGEPSSLGGAGGDGKADTAVPTCDDLGAAPDCDPCELAGLYGDGTCHAAQVESGRCLGPDPDCVDAGCFETHLIEAIELNEHRRELYADLTGDASRDISDRLIRSERLTALAARLVDRSAEFWQEHGVNIVCDEFIPISETPEFVPHAPAAPLHEFDPVSGVVLAARLTGALTLGGFERVAEVAHAEIERLADQPMFNCSVRHFLESLRRTALLAPIHKRATERLGVKSPASLSRKLVLLHIGAIPFGAALDHDAAPIQADGVPILCRDVPPIPPPDAD